MSAKSKTERKPIKRDSTVDIGLAGLVQVLTRRLYTEGSDLGALSDAELLTVGNQADNVKAAATNGLQCVGELVSAFDPDKVTLDTNAVGWLLKHLTETLEVADLIQSNAEFALNRRGYDANGKPV